MKTLAQKFAEKYNAMTRDDQAFELGLNKTFYSDDDFNGFKFEDGSRFEFNDDEQVKLTGNAVEWFAK